MDQFQENILKFINENRLIAKGETIIAGVSGGVDSIVLLHLLHYFQQILDFKVVVAHFNHGLRGNESDEDERFVGELAAKLNLPFKSGAGNVHNLMEKEKYSLEMAARRLRHEFLASVAREYGSRKIALAHHSDDQVELFFLRLLRGAGPSGLRGMKPIAPSPVARDIMIIRPLLKTTKKEIEKYAHENYLDYRTDSSNRSLYFLRNKIRNELIPLLKLEYQTSLEKIILREIDILDSDEDFIQKEAEKWLKIRDPMFKDLHPALQRKIIQLQLSSLNIEPDYFLIEKLRNNLNTQISADNGVILYIDEKGNLKIQEPPIIFSHAEQDILLERANGEIKFDNARICWEIIPLEVKKTFAHSITIENLLKQKPKNVEYFDYEKVGKEIILRHWQEGDRFTPIGMKSEIKLQDLFTNLKIPRISRHELIIAQTKEGKIFWVEGLRISEEFKLTPTTKKILKWKLIREDNQ